MRYLIPLLIGLTFVKTGKAQPKAAFSFNSFNPGHICEGWYTQFLNSSTGATSYYWEMPGCVPPTTSTGTTPGTVTYNTPGNYIITLHAINGVDTSTVSHTLQVHKKPSVSITGAQDLCANDTLILKVTPPPTSVWWIQVSWSTALIQDSIIVTTPGSYWADVTDSNQCNVGDTVQIVDGTPTPTISRVGFNLVSTATTGNQWYLNSSLLPGDTSQVLTPTSNGNYTVEVTGSNGCKGMSPGYSVTNVGINEFITPNKMYVRNGTLYTKVDWVLRDYQGRLVLSGGEGEYKLPSGNYLITTQYGSLKYFNP